MGTVGIIDILILFILIMGVTVGYKRGVIKSLVCFASLFLSVIIAFILKNELSIIFYENLPFFKFGGFLKGVTVLNILLYEVIAFILVLFIVQLIFKLLIAASTIIQKVLDLTIIFGIPSKILGGVVGLIEYYIITFIVLFVLTLPFFNFNDFIKENSNYAYQILDKTPILSSFTDDTFSIINEFALLKEKYKSEESSMQFNKDTLNLLLKYKVVDVKSIDKLIEKDKLKIDAVEEILRCYREETKHEC